MMSDRLPPDLRSISVEEMGTPVGAFLYTLHLAYRWGLMAIPSDRQVIFQGLVIDDARVADDGLVIVGPRPDPSSAPWVLAECRVMGTGAAVVDSVEAVVTLALEALRAEVRDG